jgi:hypothetical protein
VEEIKMKRTKTRSLLSAACAPVLGVLLAVPVGGLLAGAAGAGTTCYTGCTSSVTGLTASSGSEPVASDGAASSSTSSSGLAFTGADIEEMALIGVVAIGVGTVLVRSRRRTA